MHRVAIVRILVVTPMMATMAVIVEMEAEAVVVVVAVAVAETSVSTWTLMQTTKVTGIPTGMVTAISMKTITTSVAAAIVVVVVATAAAVAAETSVST